MNLAHLKKGPVRAQNNWNVIFVLVHDFNSVTNLWEFCDGFRYGESRWLSDHEISVCSSWYEVLRQDCNWDWHSLCRIQCFSPESSYLGRGSCFQILHHSSQRHLQGPTLSLVFFMPFHFSNPFFTILLSLFFFSFNFQDKKVVIFGLPVS